MAERPQLSGEDEAAPLQLDEFATDTIVSVVSGNVTGEVDRVLWRTPTWTHRAVLRSRIDGIRGSNIGTADVELDAYVTHTARCCPGTTSSRCEKR